MTVSTTHTDMCTALGIPHRDWPQVSRWANAQLDAHSRDALDAYIDVLIADRCRRVGDDLLSRLIRYGLGGVELDADDLRGIVAALLSSW
jgi:cytochrome P450